MLRSFGRGRYSFGKPATKDIGDPTKDVGPLLKDVEHTALFQSHRLPSAVIEFKGVYAPPFRRVAAAPTGAASHYSVSPMSAANERPANASPIGRSDQ